MHKFDKAHFILPYSIYDFQSYSIAISEDFGIYDMMAVLTSSMYGIRAASIL